MFYTLNDDGRAERRVQLPGLELPLIGLDPNGLSIVFVYSHFYLFGQINYNREFRLVRGTVAETDGKITYRGICENPIELSPACGACKNTALEPPVCRDVSPACIALGSSILLGVTALPINIPGNPPSKDPCKPFAETVIPFTTHRQILPYYTNSGALRKFLDWWAK